MADLDATRILPSGVDYATGQRTLDATVLLTGARPADTPANRTVGMTPATLVLDTIAGNSFAKLGEHTRANFLFYVGAAPGNAGVRVPLNLCLCLDRSGSMDGEPLEYAKRACEHVVDLLEPNDSLSIVTFSEQADILMPARRVVNKAIIKDYIRRIFIGNTTNLYDGLSAASQQLQSAQSPSTLNRILLLTDGEPTAGTQDFQSIVRLISEQKQKGITVTALGFGPDYNEELVAAIARRSGGNYYYISRPELLPEMFRRELDGLMRIQGHNLTLRLRLARGVTVRQVLGKELRKIDDRTVEVSLPDAEQGAGLTSVWDLEIASHPGGTFRIAQAELSYDEGGSSKRTTIVSNAVVEFTADSSKYGRPADPRVQNELQLAQSARDLDRTLMLGRTQSFNQKTIIGDLNRTRTILINQGKTLQAGRLDQAIAGIEGGDSVEKTLMGTIYELEQGRAT